MSKFLVAWKENSYLQVVWVEVSACICDKCVCLGFYYTPDVKKCLVMAFPNHLVVMALNQRKKKKDCKKNIKIDKLKKYIKTEQVLC